VPKEFRSRFIEDYRELLGLGLVVIHKRLEKLMHEERLVAKPVELYCRKVLLTN
jgi:hypothetical protein